MAALEIRADLKLATQTLAAMDAVIVGAAEDGLRPHLGASIIGRACDRALWYGWRWTSRAAHEARGAFGDATLLVECFAPEARHVEVQVIADAHGRVHAVGTRDCSMQRRHQKVLEEAPAPGLGALEE